jgi:hypothetical protein
MERMSELLGRGKESLSVADPYSVSHRMLHEAARWGHVVECENKVSTSGARTYTKIKFYVEHALDSFTHLHVIFDFSGDMAISSLSLNTETMLECTLPSPHGVATKTFIEQYLARIWPVHLRWARTKAEEIVKDSHQKLTEIAALR